MRRSTKRLGHVLEAYDQAATVRAPRPGAPSSAQVVSRPRVVMGDAEFAEHEAYRQGVAAQATAYLEGLQAGERVMMHFEYHTLSPIDGGPRDIDVLDALRVLCRAAGLAFAAEQVHDIGVHLTVADSWHEPERTIERPRMPVIGAG
jgi:hypothetical protein